ncbi:UNVERIFIED_CONTAM: hypothetical protein FKN15_049123 [Acipenser sinensis]
MFAFVYEELELKNISMNLLNYGTLSSRVYAAPLWHGVAVAMSEEDSAASCRSKARSLQRDMEEQTFGGDKGRPQTKTKLPIMAIKRISAPLDLYNVLAVTLLGKTSGRTGEKTSTKNFEGKNLKRERESGESLGRPR